MHYDTKRFVVLEFRISHHNELARTESLPRSLLAACDVVDSYSMNQHPDFSDLRTCVLDYLSLKASFHHTMCLKVLFCVFSQFDRARVTIQVVITTLSALITKM